MVLALSSNMLHKFLTCLNGCTVRANMTEPVSAWGFAKRLCKIIMVKFGLSRQKVKVQDSILCCQCSGVPVSAFYMLGSTYYLPVKLFMQYNKLTPDEERIIIHKGTERP